VKYRATLSPRAELDEAEIYEYLAARSAVAAHRFIDQLAETLRRMCLIPTPGMPWISENPRVAGLRWTRVRGFRKYLVFFRVTGDVIEVCRILHGARDLDSLLD
jgi:toxin ParE1/3/4